MTPIVVRIDASRIVDWPSFHAVFAEACGFPSFYGNNMNAWIDCMSYVDDPSAGMTTNIACAPGQAVKLELAEGASFAKRCPGIHRELVECVGFVNARRRAVGEPDVLKL